MFADLPKYFLVSLDEGNNGLSIIFCNVLGLIAAIFPDLWTKLSRDEYLRVLALRDFYYFKLCIMRY